MKFGTGILHNIGKVLSWVLTPYPDPGGQGAQNGVRGSSAAPTTQFDKNVTEQKLLGVPVLSWANYVIEYGSPFFACQQTNLALLV